MDWFDSVKNFGEGVWETVSTGAGNALGKWADGGFGLGGNKSGAPANAQPTNQATATPAPTNAAVNGQAVSGFMGFTNQQLMVGGGLVLTLALIAFKA